MTNFGMSISGTINSEAKQITGNTIVFSKDGKRSVIFFNGGVQSMNFDKPRSQFNYLALGYESQVSTIAEDLIEPDFEWLVDADVIGCNYFGRHGSSEFQLVVESVEIYDVDKLDFDSGVPYPHIMLSDRQLQQLNELLNEDSLNSLAG